MTYTNAHTRRGPQAPVLHASPRPPMPDGPDRYLAVCGTRVQNVTMVLWRPDGPGRLCPSCVNLTADAEAAP